MASLYKRGNVWWVKWVDHEAGGKVVRESTGLRCDRVQEDPDVKKIVRGSPV